jgi:hypothetical protein
VPTGCDDWLLAQLGREDLFFLLTHLLRRPDVAHPWLAPAAGWRGKGWTLNLCLFGHLQGIIDFDAQVSDCALHFRVTQQQLDRTQVLCSPVDQ